MFSGLRVLELQQHLAGALCGRLFAGWGADVRTILPADPAFQPLSPEASLWANAGKQATTDALADACATADLIIDAWAPGALEAAGIDPTALVGNGRRPVLCRITPFGQSGPWRDFAAEEITLYALAGLMNSTGDGHRAPLNARPPLASVSAGLYGFIASAMALHRRHRDGRGECIDLSIQEAAMQNIEIILAEYAHHGRVARRNGDRHAMVPWRTYPCRDGEATIIGGPIRNWRKIAPRFGEPALLEPPLSTAAGRIEHRERFESLIRPWLASQTREDLFHLGQANGLAWSYVATLPEVLRDAQHQARGYFQQHPDANGRTRILPGAPWRGQHLRWDAPPTQRTPTPPPAATDAPATPPLAGCRILDFTHDWAGPHAARVLGDFGAEVIKVEFHGRLDGMRGAYPERVNGFPRFWQLHRNKQSITLDLKHPDDRALCHALVRDTDVVLENGRPGVMARLGVDYDSLRALKPDIILASLSAFGATGPYQGYAGYGGTLEAISGVQSLTAYAEGETPYRVREMDVINGMFGAAAVMSALLQRDANGTGEHVDLSENETSIWTLGAILAGLPDAQTQPAALGNRHPQHAPQGCYPCEGEDRWLTLCIRDDAEWARLAAHIGDDALRPEWRTVEGRRADHDAIDTVIADWTRSQDTLALMASLQADGLAAGTVMNAADLHASDHLAARAWFITHEKLTVPGFPFHFASAGGTVRSLGPDLGQDNARHFVQHPRGLAAQPDLSPDKLGTAYV